MMTRFARIAITAAFCVTPLACDDAFEGALDADIEAGCAIFSQAAEAALLARAAESGALETFSRPDQRYEVGFEDTALEHVGFLLFSPERSARYLFLLDVDLPIRVTDLASNEVAPARIERQNPACAQASVVYTFDLEPSVYTLRLGPTAAGAATLVLRQAAAATP
jgi:hypothetical protein